MDNFFIIYLEFPNILHIFVKQTLKLGNRRKSKQNKKMENFKTKKGVEVSIVKSDTEGVSLKWYITYPSLCSDSGETVPTNYKFPTSKHKKKYTRVSDEQVVIDLFKKIKRKRWFCKLDFSDISSIVYKHLKEVYGDDGLKYYETNYID